MKIEDIHKNEEEFKVPKAYFDTFDESFFKDFDFKKRFSKEASYKIPEGYMDTLEDRIYDTIRADESNSKPVIQLWKHKYRYVAISVAASLVFLLALNFFSVDGGEKYDTVALKDAEIEHYLDNHTFLLNEYDIAQIYKDVDLDEIYFNTEAIEEDHLIDYIYDHSTDYDLLIDEY